MPLYDLRCVECGTVKQVMLGLSEMAALVDSKRENMNLKENGVRCKCGSTHFEKLLSVTAKMGHNWSEWQRKR